MLILTDATVLCRWILREVEAVFSFGHFLLVNRTLASRHILGNNRCQSQQSRLELGCVSARDYKGRTIWIVDAHRDGKRFVVHADEKLRAFLELEVAIRN